MAHIVDDDPGFTTKEVIKATKSSSSLAFRNLRSPEALIAMARNDLSRNFGCSILVLQKTGSYARSLTQIHQTSDRGDSSTVEGYYEISFVT